MYECDEIWKPIPDGENYEVSNLGNVRSVDRYVYNGKGYAEFCCGNEDSEEYGVPTFFDDTCDYFEEKE